MKLSKNARILLFMVALFAINYLFVPLPSSKKLLKQIGQVFSTNETLPMEEEYNDEVNDTTSPVLVCPKSHINNVVSPTEVVALFYNSFVLAQ